MKLSPIISLLLLVSALHACVPGPGPGPVAPSPPSPAPGASCSAAARRFVTELGCAPGSTEADFERLCEGAEAGGGSSSIGPACIAQADSCDAADRCQPGQVR